MTDSIYLFRNFVIKPSLLILLMLIHGLTGAAYIETAKNPSNKIMKTDTNKIMKTDTKPWINEQKFIQGLHQEFLNHIAGAKNITVPMSPKAFHWEVDWDTQQDYCKDVANVLFHQQNRLSFPEPLFASSRDPLKKLDEMADDLAMSDRGLCGSMTAELTQEFRGQTSESLRYSTSCKDPVRVYSYTGIVKEPRLERKIIKTIVVRERIKRLCVAGGAKFTNVYVDESTTDDDCQVDLGSTAAGYSGGRSNNQKVILAAIDEEPTIFEFGTYTSDKGKDYDETEGDHPDQPSLLYGKNGQHYVLVRKYGRSFVDLALTDPGKYSKWEFLGGMDYSSQDDDHKYACFINFDGKNSRHRQR